MGERGREKERKEERDKGAEVRRQEECGSFSCCLSARRQVCTHEQTRFLAHSCVFAYFGVLLFK